MEARVPFGMVDGHWVVPTEVTDGARNVTCPVCAAALSVVRDHTRLGAEVGRHFRHATDVSCELAGESWLHKAAKIAVVATVSRWLAGGPRPRLELDCASCGKRVRDQIGRKRTILGAKLEQTLRTVSGEFRLDVALLGGADVVIGAVEIFVSHEIGSLKRAALAEAGLGVVELDAVAILEDPLVWRERSHWRCPRCGGRRAVQTATSDKPIGELSAGIEPIIALRRIRGLPKMSSEVWRAVERQETENPLAVRCPETRTTVGVKSVCASCPFFVAAKWWIDDVTVFCNSEAPLHL